MESESSFRNNRASVHTGLIHAAAAYAIWGLLPIFWKSVQIVPATEILCHRMTWSLFFLLAIHAYRKDWIWIQTIRRSPRFILIYAGSAGLLAVNWLTYIWAVNAGQILETSLGYFINPIISVCLGVIILRERLRPGQWASVILACSGVIYLTARHGSFPWIALVLAVSFGLYGLIRKMGPLGAFDGLTIETATLFFPAIIAVFYLEATGSGSLTREPWPTGILLFSSGGVTAIPLLLFASGARRIRLVTLGMLHYIAPTLQFLIGLIAYHEPFTQDRAVGFVLVWLSLIVFTAEGIRHADRVQR